MVLTKGTFTGYSLIGYLAIVATYLFIRRNNDMRTYYVLYTIEDGKKFEKDINTSFTTLMIDARKLHKATKKEILIADNYMNTYLTLKDGEERMQDLYEVTFSNSTQAIQVWDILTHRLMYSVPKFSLEGYDLHDRITYRNYSNQELREWIMEHTGATLLNLMKHYHPDSFNMHHYNKRV